MLGTLTADEDRVCSAIENGEATDFSVAGNAGAPKPVLRAEMLRRLAAGLQISASCPGPRKIAAGQLVIRGAAFRERVDLRDICCSGGSAPAALVLTDCVFELGLDLRGAQLARLDLSGSQFGGVAEDDAPQLDLRGARIMGDVDISKIMPQAADTGELWVRADDVRVGASLAAREAKLRAPAARNPVPKSRKRCALQLSNAEIGSDLSLTPAFVAEGGVSLVNAVIGGDVWLHGAAISGIETDALNAQFAEIGGCLCIGNSRGYPEFPDTVEINGGVNLFGADINFIWLNGAVIKSRDGAYALSIQNIRTEHLLINRCEDIASHIGGHFVMSGEIKVNLRIEAMIAGSLDIRRLEVAGDCSVECERIEGYCLILGKVHGDFSLKGSIGYALSLAGLRVDRNLKIDCETIGQDIEANDLSVGGDVELKCRLGAPGQKAVCRMAGAEIDGTLDISRLSYASHFGSYGSAAKDESKKYLFIENSKIGGSLRTGSSTVQAWKDAVRELRSVRTRTLSCYRGVKLVELESRAAGSPPSSSMKEIASYLIGQGGWVRRLNGKSNIIHEINASKGLRLNTKAQARDYLEFFCAHVWAKDKPWSDLESWFKILHPGKGKTATLAGTRPTLRQDEPSTSADVETSDAKPTDAAPLPPYLDSGEAATLVVDAPTLKQIKNVWHAEAYVGFAGKAFKATFIIPRTGVIEMVNDDLRLMSVDNGDIVFDSERGVRTIQKEPPELFRRSMSGGWTPLAERTPKAEERARRRDARRRQSDDAGLSGWMTAAAKRTLIALVRAPDEVSWQRWIVDLSGVKVGTLDDGDGRYWGRKAVLNLDRFNYGAIAAPDTKADERLDGWGTALESLLHRHWMFWSRDLWLGVHIYWRAMLRTLTYTAPAIDDLDRTPEAPAWRMRERWLRLQFRRRRPALRTEPVDGALRNRATDYDAQPYTHLADVLRRSGDFDGARNIDAARITIEMRLFTRRLMWPVSRLISVVQFAYWAGYRYGLSMIRALFTPIIFWALGALCVMEAQSRDILVVNTTPVASVAREDGLALKPASQRIERGDTVTEFDCSDGLNSTLYAIDLFIPLIDLGEEGKCGVRGARKAGPPKAYSAGPLQALDVALDQPSLWRWARSIYAMLGWIVMSLSVLTISGVLRGRIERAQ